MCISNYTEEETGRRLAFSLTLNSECSNLTVLVGESEKKRKSCGPQLVSYWVYFWSLFKFDRNHFKKISFVKVWARKTCLRPESTHTWRELFQILKVCHLFFLIFSIQLMLISTVYDIGLT